MSQEHSLRGISLYKRYPINYARWEAFLPYPTWGATFCEILARTGNIGLAAQATGVNLATLRRYLRGEEPSHSRTSIPRGPNRDFVEDVNSSLDAAVEQLRAEAWRRAAAGSDQLLIFLLKAHDPDLYNPPRVIEHKEDPAAMQQIEEMRRRLLSRFAPPELEGPQEPIDVVASEVESADAPE